MTDPIFVHLPSDDGNHSYVSLYQIVMVTDMSDDQLTLHLSDGNRITVQGKFVVERLTGLLARHAMSIDGQSFEELAEDLPPDGPVLIKPPNPES